MKMHATQNRIAALTMLNAAPATTAEVRLQLGLDERCAKSLLGLLASHGIITKEPVYGGKWRIV